MIPSSINRFRAKSPAKRRTASIGSVPVIEHKPLRSNHVREAFIDRLLVEGEEAAGATAGDYQREAAEKDR